MPRHITGEDLYAAFGIGADADRVPAEFRDYLGQVDTRYREPTRAEAERHILDSLQRADRSRRTDASGNRQAFDDGWRENLEQARARGVSMDSLKPRYFRPGTILRYRGGIIVGDNPDLEYDLFYLARLLIFSSQLSGFRHIYEFGCGSCANLLMLSRLFDRAELCGLDWAGSSMEIAQLLEQDTGGRVRGLRMDMSQPDPGVRLEPGAAVMTVHALEQIGDRWQGLLRYFLDQKPARVVHYEPIEELYDPDQLYDYLALNYSRKRGYLRGYLGALRELRDQGRVEIEAGIRPGIGGVFHESSLIAWRPL